MTQMDAVIEHLKRYKSITSIEAIDLYGATRLSDIIYRLRHKGYTITAERFVVTTRFGHKTAPVRYTLVKGKNGKEKEKNYDKKGN